MVAIKQGGTARAAIDGINKTIDNIIVTVLANALMSRAMALVFQA
jgi:hypothetical protein